MLPLEKLPSGERRRLSGRPDQPERSPAQPGRVGPPPRRCRLSDRVGRVSTASLAASPPRRIGPGGRSLLARSEIAWAVRAACFRVNDAFRRATVPTRPELATRGYAEIFTTCR
jgi:hypothetical protein